MKKTESYLPPPPQATGDYRVWLMQIELDGWWAPAPLQSPHDCEHSPVVHFDGITVYALAHLANSEVTIAAFDSRGERDRHTIRLTETEGPKTEHGATPGDLPA